MNLYEINAQIIEAFDAAIDPETGELLDEVAFDRLSELQEAFDDKVYSLALYAKDLKAQAVALKAEKEAFAKRQKAAERRVESIERYLQNALHGEKRTFTKAAISYRKSEAVVLEDAEEFAEFYKDREFVKENVEYLVDKNAIKSLLKQGEILLGAHLEERQNIQIK